MEVEQYKTYIEQYIFPESLQALTQCRNVTELTLWKKQVIKQLSQSLKDEDKAPLDETFDEELSMA